MYNESDYHTGCESCGVCAITYYKNNYGFYCDECIEEAKESEYRSKQDDYVLCNKIRSYLLRVADRDFSKSNLYYFKSKFFKDYLILNKESKRIVLKSTISIFKSIQYYEQDIYIRNKQIFASILNLLFKQRNSNNLN